VEVIHASTSSATVPAAGDRFVQLLGGGGRRLSDGLFGGGVEHRQAARGAPLSAVDGHRVVGHRRRIEHEQTYLSID
jgi:hypothetical protein